MFRFTALSLAFAAATPTFADDLPVYPGETTVVTANRAPAEINRVAADVTVLAGDELHASGARTVGEVLDNQPALGFAREGGPGQRESLFIRGTESRHVLILVDGQRISSATTGVTTLELLPVDQIDRIEIVRGPASSLYGSDAVGGVIQIFTKRGQGKPAGFASIEAGSWGQVGASAGVSGAMGDTRFKLTANQSQADGFSAVANPKNYAYDPDRDGYRRKGAGLDVSHFIDEQNELGLRGLYQEQQTDIDAGALHPNAMAEQQISSFQLYSKNKLDKDWNAEFRVGQSKDHYVSDAYAARYVTWQDQLAAQSRLKTAWGEWLMAYDYVRDHVDSATQFTRTARENHSLMLGWQQDFDQQKLEAQVRRDRNSQFGMATTGRLGYAYLPSKEWKWYAQAGQAFHAPTFNDAYQPTYLDSYADPAFGYYYRYDANPNLKPEKSRSYEAGFAWQDKIGQKASLTAYHTEIRDLITLVTLVEDYGQANYPYGYTVQGMGNISSAVINGVDGRTTGKYSIYTFEAWGNWMSARNSDTDARLPRRAWASGGTRFSVEPRKGLTGYVEVTGQGVRFDDLKNTKPMHGYGLTNLGASYRIDKAWLLSGKIGNVFDRSYELVRDYSTSGRNVMVKLSWNGQ